jgi:hypothetical protein
MATRSGALALVRDPASSFRPARPAPRDRKPRQPLRSPAELGDRVDGLELQLEGLKAQLAAREQQLATLVDTVEKQRLENIQLIDLVLAASKASVADTKAKEPDDGRPKWLWKYCICKRTGEVLVWTEGGWVMAYWTKTAEQRERIRQELAKYPLPCSRSTR